MGNIESSVDDSLSRRSSQRKSGSPSPPATRRSNSFKKQNGVRPEQSFRRSKTCRAKDRTHRPRPLCVVTGMSHHQKTLLTKRWCKMDNSTLYEMGKRVFEHIFTETPAYVAYIGLREEEHWRRNIAFRMHAQRFVSAICECLRRMRDPHAACDVLRDFGAHYAQYGRVSAGYFEKLAVALNNAAIEYEEHMALVDYERLRSASADPSSTSACEVSSLKTSTTSVSTMNDKDGLLTPENFQGRRLVSRHSDSSMYRVRPSHLSNSPPISSPSPLAAGQQSAPATPCPLACEAWTVFSAFVANQVKLGYELERILQHEMAKLGLSTNVFYTEGDTPYITQQPAVNVEQ